VSYGPPDRPRIAVPVLGRLSALLPPGTVAVGAGLAVLGAASYVHIAVASHALSKEHNSAFAVVWSIVFTVGLGLFLPIEQEITRIVVSRRGAGLGILPVYRRGAVLALGLLVTACVILVATAGPVSGRLFGGDKSLLIAMAGGFAGLAVAHPTRGVLAGTGRFGAYGLQLGVDGGLRIVLAVALGAAGVHSALLFGLILAVAPVVSVLVTARPVRSALSVGPPLPWQEFARGVAPLMVSTLLAQLVVNVGVVNVKLLDPSDVALAGALLSALVLVRIPLFVFASLQASLLTGLSTSAAAGDGAGFRHLLRRACGIVMALALVGAVPTIVFGPWLLRVFFNTAESLDRLDFAILCAGTGAYLLAQVLGQGAISLGHHRDQTYAWLAGTAALIVITVMPGSVSLRVEGGYAIGSAVVAAVLAVAVSRRAAHPHGPGANGNTAALVALGGGD
jgi:O-antigen/teichoic acid export membrane protein